MSNRQKWSLAAVMVAFGLLCVWALCTRAMACELAESRRAAEQAQGRCDTLADGIAALRSKYDALREYNAELVALCAEAEENAATALRLAKLPRIDGCTVSHYCCEKRAHICGTGNGITASGGPVQAGVSVAVDPRVIPLGSTVYVDYGDGVVHTYIAHDTGGAVNGAHIDVAVATHDEALRRGLKVATVWWEE